MFRVGVSGGLYEAARATERLQGSRAAAQPMGPSVARMGALANVERAGRRLINAAVEDLHAPSHPITRSLRLSSRSSWHGTVGQLAACFGLKGHALWHENCCAQLRRIPQVLAGSYWNGPFRSWRSWLNIRFSVFLIPLKRRVPHFKGGSCPTTAAEHATYQVNCCLRHLSWPFCSTCTPTQSCECLCARHSNGPLVGTCSRLRRAEKLAGAYNAANLYREVR